MRTEPRPSNGFLRSLRARLALGFALLVLLALSMGLTGLYYTGQMSSAATQTYTQEVVPLEALDDVKSALYRIQADTLEHVLTPDAASRSRLGLDIAEQGRRVRDRLEQYQATRLRAPERQLVEDFQLGYEAYISLVEAEILPLSAAGRRQEAEALARSSAVEVFAEARNAMNALMDYNLRRAQERALAVEDDRRRAIATLAVVLGLVVAAGLALSLSLARRINQPIAQVTEYVRGLGDGRLDNDIPCGRPDEFGQIFSALGDTQDRLRESDHQRAQAYEQMAYQAFHDPLTGLPNRLRFQDRLEQAQARDGSDHLPVSVVMLDLDGFKMVNDAHGHLVGDALLEVVGRRVRECVRGDDTIARLGGDEFAILIEHGTTQEAVTIAERTVAALASPYDVGGRRLSVTCSAGVASATTGRGEPGEDLLRNADVAMYAAKSLGKDRVALFDQTMYEAVLHRSELQAGLDRALGAGELSLVYQPLVGLGSGEVTSVEALLRWRRADGRQVPPLEFIPLAEESGAIVAIGRWVLEEATRTAARISRTAHRPVAVAVNVAASQVAQPDFAQVVRQALADAGLPAHQLVLEVTESALVEPDTAAVAALEDLRRSGVLVAIDDFGTGYSSLSQLRTLPVDILKIDRSFISELTHELSRAPLMAAVVAMAQSLHLQVVAEGVETTAQLTALRRLGCDTAQGFLLGRPQPGDEMLLLPRRALLAGLDPVAVS